MNKNSPAPKVVHGKGVVPKPDPAVTKIEDDFMTKSKGTTEAAIKSLSIASAFPTRPAHGANGAAVTLWANFFEIKPKPSLAYYRYSIEVTAKGTAPAPSKTKIKRILALLLEDEAEFCGAYTDSRSNLYSLKKLDGTPKNITIPFLGQDEDTPATNPTTFSVLIQETGTTLISDYFNYLKSTATHIPQFSQRDEVLQTLNIVLGHYPHRRLDIATIGQNKHYPIEPAVWRNLTGGLHAIRGIFTSVRPGTNRLLLNVNASHTVSLAHGPLSALIPDSGLLHDIPRLSRMLKLIRVKRTHLPDRKNKAGKSIPYISVILDVARTTDGKDGAHPPQVLRDGAGPKDVKFFLEDALSVQPSAKRFSGKTTGKSAGGAAGVGGRYISVWDYFARTYPKTKLNVILPVVNIGDKSRAVYLPVEVCEVLPGQPVATKLNPVQTREMIAFACRRPAENADSVVETGTKVLGIFPPKNPALIKKELTIAPTLITVQARVLQAPQIQYSGKKSLHPCKGSWNMAADMKFYKGSSINPWVYINIRSPNSTTPAQDVNLDNSVKRFVEAMKRLGMTVSAPAKVSYVNLTDNQDKNKIIIQNCLNQCLNASNKPRFALVILPANDTTIYGQIKSVADRLVGFHTVCVVYKKFTTQKGEDQYFTNVAMKFNLKAGGINQVLDTHKMGIIKDGTTMVVGIDVTHPSPQSQGNAPSVAGIVASIDNQLGQWPSTTRAQTGRTEMVADLEEMFKSRLILWHKHNKNTYPRNILVYRDGVSEGQYQLVLDEEVPQLREACKKLYPPKSQPFISVIIVGKRHHVRFYPTSTVECDDKSNCKNGTVVDRGVTEVRFWDFYLQAHACLQGTARSAHYFVILDEIFRKKAGTMLNAATQLEELTHNLCHLFGRATKAVSVCPPAYYADLLCERSRYYLSNYFDPATLLVPSEADKTKKSSPKEAKGKGKSKGKEDDIPPPSDEMRATIVVHPTLENSMYYI